MAGEIVLCVVIMSCCDASQFLQLPEHAFDKVSAFVGFGVERVRRQSLVGR